MNRSPLRTFLTPPDFPGDEVKTLRARLLHNALLTTVALTAFLIPAALLGHFPGSVIALEIGMALTPLFLRPWVFQGRLKLASGTLLAVALIVLTAAIARLGTIRVPATGFYIALVLAAGLFLDFSGLAVMTVLSSLAVAGLILAENAGLLPRPDYAVTITQWLATTGFLVCIGGWAFAVLEAFRLALQRAELAAGTHQRQETRLNLAMEAARQSWFELDLRTGAAVTSEEYPRMLGFDAATFTSTQANWLENIHPEDRPALEETFRRCLTSGQTLSAEYRRRTAAGGWLWLHSVGRVVERDAAGQPVRVTGIHSDITTRKRAEQILHESEARYRLLVDTAPDGIAMHRAGKIIFANAAALRMFGATKPEELVGTPMIERVHPDHRPVALARAQMALADGKPLPPMEEKFLRLDGTVFDIEVSGGSVFFDGQPTVQLFGRDITDRKRAEAALREVEGRYHRLVEAAFDGSVVHQDGLIVDANGAYAKMYGYTIAELLGKPILDMAPPEHRSKVASAIQRQDHRPYESVGLRRDGTQFLVETAGESCTFRGRPARIAAVRDITERRRSETELALREARFRAIFDHAPVGISFTTEQGVVLVNAEHARITGVPIAESHLPGVFVRASHPEDLPRQQEADQAFLRGEVDHFTIEKRYLHPDGRLQWAELTSRYFPDPTTGKRWIVTVLTDIAQRKSAELALRASEERFRTLYENAVVGFYRTTPEGRILMANPALVKMLGYASLEELTQRNLEQTGFEPGYQRAAFKEQIEREGQIAGLETVWRRSNGSLLFVSENSKAIRDESGRILYYDGSVEDITERKQAELALIKSEGRFHAITDFSPDIISIFDRDGRILFNSAAAGKIHGYQAGKLESNSTMDFIHPDDRSAVAEVLSSLLKAPAKVAQVRYRYRNADGSYKWMEAFARNELANPHINGILAVSRDITERKQAEVALQILQTQLAQAMDQAHLADWEMEAATNTFIFNDRFYALYGTTAEREGGYRMPAEVYAREFLPPEDQPVVPDDVAKLLSGTIDELQQEHRIRRRDGQLRHIVVRVTVVRDATGRVVGTRGTNQDITDRKRAEEENRTILRTTIDGFYLVDLEGRILEANDAYCAMIGYSREELRQIGVKGVEAIETQEVIQQRIQRILQTGSDRFETRHIRKDGRIIDVEAAVNLIKEPGRLFIFMRDITARKQAEAALRESEARFRNFFELSADLVCISDLEGRFREINTAFTKVLGYAKEDLVSQPFFDFVHPEDRKKTRQIITEKLQQGETVLHFENRYLRKDGGVVWLEWTSQPSVAMGVTFAIARDITERKREVDQLEKSERQLKESQHVARLGTWDLDLVASKLEWTEETFALFDQTPATFTPSFEAFAQFVHPDDRPTMQAAWDRALASDATPYHVAVRIVNATGRPWVMEAFGSVRRDADGRPRSIFGTAQDVTERIALEQQLLELLAQSERDSHTKGELLREVNHRVTNHLAAVLGLIAFEAEHAPTTAAQVISPVMDRLGQRIRGLLQVHRMLAQSAWAPVRIDQLAGQIIRAALSAASGRKPVIVLITPTELKVSPRQAGTLAMVLSELATNTVKHAGPAAADDVSVRFATEHDAETITLRYHDNGPGYAPEVLKNERTNVGLKLIRELVAGSLRGTVTLSNDGGAVTTIRIRQEEETRT